MAELLNVRTVESKIRDAITRMDERDLQVKIGPSDLGDQCEYCLGEAMIRTSGGGRFGLKAWVGTAVHEKLERDRQDEPDIRTEAKVYIGEIHGYGAIHGHCDLYDDEFVTVVDYKTSDLKKIKSYKKQFLRLPSGKIEIYDNTVLKYYIQGNLYGLGYENQGVKVEKVGLYFIPRDSNSIDDCWFFQFDYNRDIAVAYLDRAQAIWDHVSVNGLDDLEPEPDCYNCKMRQYA